MARSLRDSKLDSREGRLRLKARSKPYYRLVESGLHLGYRRLSGRSGTWCVRRYLGNQAYTVEAIGTADDYDEADGHDTLDFSQAVRRALAHKPRPKAGALTVATACQRYFEDLADRGKSTRDAELRVNAPAVLRRYVPAYDDVYRARGWSMFPEIDRVYVNERARIDLGWRPRHDFANLIARIGAGEDHRSPLALAVGAKGYHDVIFEGGPYPV